MADDRPTPSSITRTITGPKAAVIADLQERADSEMRTYRAVDSYPRWVREHARGVAEGIEYAQATIRDWQVSTRTWLYGLTADEWFHLASEGENSEVTPCCGNIGELRDLLRELMVFQAEHEWGFRISIGDQILQIIGADGDMDDHDLRNGEAYPLLYRVMTGYETEKKARQAQFETAFPEPTITADSREDS